MDSTKDFKRTKISFEARVPISKKTKELLVDNFGYVRAVLDGGVVKVQVKKLKGGERELVRIDTNVSPPTIEFILEENES
jgi:hypothetical protein